MEAKAVNEPTPPTPAPPLSIAPPAVRCKVVAAKVWHDEAGGVCKRTLVAPVLLIKAEQRSDGNRWETRYEPIIQDPKGDVLIPACDLYLKHGYGYEVVVCNWPECEDAEALLQVRSRVLAAEERRVGLQRTAAEIMAAKASGRSTNPYEQHVVAAARGVGQVA